MESINLILFLVNFALSLINVTAFVLLYRWQRHLSDSWRSFRLLHGQRLYSVVAEVYRLIQESNSNNSKEQQQND